jgi:hypothetical protein
MAITSEKIEGTKIINEVKSSNIVRTQYDTENKEMIVEFKNNSSYKYLEVPHNTYVKFRKSDSQGKFFMSEIAKKYKYVKL